MVGEKETTNSKTLQQLFVGSGKEFITAKEQDGSTYDSVKDIDLRHLLLPVSETPLDLHAALENYMRDDRLDFTTEKGHKTTAERSLWFEKLPPVLMAQQNRVKFDAKTKTYKKLTTPLFFAKEIFMDRYYLENHDQTTATRKIVRGWELCTKQATGLYFGNYEFQKKRHLLRCCAASCVMESITWIKRQKLRSRRLIKKRLSTHNSRVANDFWNYLIKATNRKRLVYTSYAVKRQPFKDKLTVRTTDFPK